MQPRIPNSAIRSRTKVGAFRIDRPSKWLFGFLLSILVIVSNLGINPSSVAAAPVLTINFQLTTTVEVPPLLEITVATSEMAAVDVSNPPAGDLGAYQFELSYDPAVVQVTGVLGGAAPFDGVTAFNIDNAPDPVTGLGLVQWNHFQGGQAPVPVSGLTVASVEFLAVGQAGDCSPIDITVTELVDNQGVPIPNLAWTARSAC